MWPCVTHLPAGGAGREHQGTLWSLAGDSRGGGPRVHTKWIPTLEHRPPLRSHQSALGRLGGRDRPGRKWYPGCSPGGIPPDHFPSQPCHSYDEVWFSEKQNHPKKTISATGPLVPTCPCREGQARPLAGLSFPFSRILHSVDIWAGPGAPEVTQADPGPWNPTEVREGMNYLRQKRTVTEPARARGLTELGWGGEGLVEEGTSSHLNHQG